jgi:hypothetical protein
MARSNGHLPDDWHEELLVCPDSACGKLMKAGTIKGEPPCAGPVHRRTGKYPRMERVPAIRDKAA